MALKKRKAKKSGRDKVAARPAARRPKVKARSRARARGKYTGK